jgi:hypothetical protein
MHYLYPALVLFRYLDIRTFILALVLVFWQGEEPQVRLRP